MSGWIPESAIPDVVEALFAAKHDIETAEVNSEAPQLNIAELSERFNLHTVPPVYVDSPS